MTTKNIKAFNCFLSMQSKDFNKLIEKKMQKFVYYIYDLSKKFPKEEIYGITSQLRRASLSAALNHVEGYARRKNKVKLNFWKISYGSLKESKFILELILKENYININEFDTAHSMFDELCKTIQ